MQGRFRTAAGPTTLGERGLAGRRTGYSEEVPLGTSIFLIAVGAILRWAITASTSGINLQTVGLILIIVGVVGLLLSIFWMLAWSPRRRVGNERVVERDPYREPPVY